MKHLGDVTTIKGDVAPVVDVIIGGSPCQDLSVAGKREGLAGERSGLFMEQIRIIKEMRKADAERGNTDVDIRPRYAVWENVPGALSSPGKGHQGEDFAAVLEEFVRIAEPEAPSISVPEKGWPTSGCILGNKWSVAWRILDAQFWGVPQRRRRIALVADFGGQSAPEILFVPDRLSGNFEPSQPKRKATARTSSDGLGANDRVPYTMKIRSGVEVDSSGKAAGKGALIQTDLSATLGVTQDQYLFQPTAVGFPLGFRPENVRCYEETATTLCNGTRPGFTTGVIQKTTVYGISPYHSNAMKSDNPHSGIYEAATARSLDAMNCGHPGCNQGGMAVVEPVEQRYIVRRLTPLECERLQGFPDGWTDIGEWVDSKGKKHKEADSHRYKALGNSIALPPWKWVLKRLCACYERDATMASLFDGIGGFPLIWEQINGKGSCLWASEVEEFPMAVTKLRFGDST